jgi:hypothetical protein
MAIKRRPVKFIFGAAIPTNGVFLGNFLKKIAKKVGVFYGTRFAIFSRHACPYKSPSKI